MRVNLCSAEQHKGEGMTKLFDFRKPLSTAFIGSIALTIGVLSVQPSFAGSGRGCVPGNCPAYKVSSMCNAALNVKGLKGPERKAEFEKCKLDPFNYK
jgi:hypothetical protein